MHYDVSRTNWKAAKYILLIQDGGAQYITFFSPVDLFIITFKYIAKTCSLVKVSKSASAHHFAHVCFL